MSPSDAHPAQVTLVRAPACHFCHDAQEALDAIAAEHPLSVTTIEADSAEGRALMAEHRPPMAPLVLLNGAYFSAGRLPRNKLTKALSARAETRAGTDS